MGAMALTRAPALPLGKLAQARQLLAECQSIDDAKGIRDQAEAVRAYCKQQSEGLDAQNFAAEIKLRAERKCGELLAAMELHGSNQHGSKLHDATSLQSLGIAKHQSHRWQTEAAVPDDVFDDFIRMNHEAGRELTSASLYKLGKKTIATKPDAIIPTPPTADGTARVVRELSQVAGERFGCIYADPPWQYGNQSTRAATDNHYRTMTVEQLCEMPVSDLAADDAHLHLWTTNAFLPDSFRVMEAWGFEYRSVYVWVKPQMGIGNYWRVSHEFLLLGIRGDAKRFLVRDKKSWGEWKRSRHSEKPDGIRQLVELVSPGPFLELFGRSAIHGWTVMGNQVEERLFA